jgi:hypothetical protein
MTRLEPEVIYEEIKRVKTNNFFRGLIFYTLVVCGVSAWLSTFIFVLVSGMFQ